MQPNRAAWFFAAGLAWLVLRGIVVQAFPALGAGPLEATGALSVAVRLLTVVASASVPGFFISFLANHRFVAQPLLKGSTVLAAVTSLGSFALVLFSFVVSFGDAGSTTGGGIRLIDRVVTSVPLLFVVSVFLFLAAFYLCRKTISPSGYI